MANEIEPDMYRLSRPLSYFDDNFVAPLASMEDLSVLMTPMSTPGPTPGPSPKTRAPTQLLGIPVVSEGLKEHSNIWSEGLDWLRHRETLNTNSMLEKNFLHLLSVSLQRQIFGMTREMLFKS